MTLPENFLLHLGKKKKKKKVLVCVELCSKLFQLKSEMLAQSATVAQGSLKTSRSSWCLSPGGDAFHVHRSLEEQQAALFTGKSAAPPTDSVAMMTYVDSPRKVSATGGGAGAL